MTDKGPVDPVDSLTLLAERAVDDQVAMSELLARLLRDGEVQPPIRRYLFNEDDVAMAEQQTLVAVAFKLGQWSGRGAFGPWVRQVAANEAKTLIRARSRRRTYEDEAAADRAAVNRTAAFVERMSSQLATEADVRRCMNQLPAELADPLTLRSDGYGYRDIAANLGIPEGTAKTRVRQARQALAQALTGADRR